MVERGSGPATGRCAVGHRDAGLHAGGRCPGLRPPVLPLAGGRQGRDPGAGRCPSRQPQILRSLPILSLPAAAANPPRVGLGPGRPVGVSTQIPRVDFHLGRVLHDKHHPADESLSRVCQHGQAGQLGELLTKPMHNLFDRLLSACLPIGFFGRVGQTAISCRSSSCHWRILICMGVLPDTWRKSRPSFPIC